MSEAYLGVQVDAAFLMRLSGKMAVEAGKAKMAGNVVAAAVLSGVSSAVFETLMELGEELRGGSEDGDRIETGAPERKE